MNKRILKRALLCVFAAALLVTVSCNTENDSEVTTVTDMTTERITAKETETAAVRCQLRQTEHWRS